MPRQEAENGVDSPEEDRTSSPREKKKKSSRAEDKKTKKRRGRSGEGDDDASPGNTELAIVQHDQQQAKLDQQRDAGAPTTVHGRVVEYSETSTRGRPVVVEGHVLGRQQVIDIDLGDQRNTQEGIAEAITQQVDEQSQKQDSSKSGCFRFFKLLVKIGIGLPVFVALCCLSLALGLLLSLITLPIRCCCPGGSVLGPLLSLIGVLLRLPTMMWKNCMMK